MASTHPHNPVMHCAAVEFQAVNTLATRVINFGIYVNTTLFPSPPVTQAVFTAANAKLTSLISQAKGNSQKVKERDDQAILVHGYLLQLLKYSTPICNNITANIDQTGFDSSSEPTPTVVPAAPVITKVAEGKIAGTYKVLLEKKKSKEVAVAKSKSHGKGNTRYTVQTTVTPTVEASWVTQLEGAASTKLVFKGLVAGRNYIRVYGINSAGKGQPSAPYPFTPQL
jgi:hypothetical protein